MEVKIRVWLIDWVKVLRPTRHKIGHFGDQTNLLAWSEKATPNATKHTFTNQNHCTTTQNKHKKLKPGLVASYDIRPGNGEGLFLFRRFINLSLTYLLKYLPTYYSLGPTRGSQNPGHELVFWMQIISI